MRLGGGWHRGRGRRGRPRHHFFALYFSATRPLRPAAYHATTPAATTAFFPIAKGFGQTLNFNCTAMLLPVTRFLVAFLHSRTAARGANRLPILLRWVPHVLPLDKNIVAHKAIAKYFIAFGVLGHAAAHYAHASTLAAPRDQLFGGAGLTGHILSLLMVLIYASAHERVKRLQFETFFAFHHLLIFWFALLLAHGPVFYRWATAPLALYALERLHRQFFRGGKKVALLRFRLFGDVKRPAVFALEFENARSMAERNLLYMEGQYLYLNCPHVSTWEWHPFTISSAPDDEVLTVNIRVMPDAASWTSKVCRYLQKLNPHDQPSVVLSRRDQATGALADGKVRGPDGKILFRIDGLFGAPAQHFFNYRVAMLVGAGSGHPVRVDLARPRPLPLDQGLQAGAHSLLLGRAQDGRPHVPLVAVDAPRPQAARARVQPKLHRPE